MDVSNTTVAGETPAPIGHNLPESTSDRLAVEHAGILNAAEALAQRANKARDALELKDTIANDNELDPFVKIGVDAAKLVKQLDETRLETTKPLREETDETNKFFNTIAERMKRIKGAFERLVGDYHERVREAERLAAAEEARLAEEEAKRKLEAAAASDHSVAGDVLLQDAQQAQEKAKHFAYRATSAGSGPTRTSAGTISQRTKWDFRIVDASKIDLNALRPHFGIADIEKAIRSHVRANRNTAPLAGVEIFQDHKTSFRG